MRTAAIRVSLVRRLLLAVACMWLVAAAAAPGVARGAPAAVREVATEGAGDRLWVAEVVAGDPTAPTPQAAGERTRLYTVQVMGSDGWRRATTIGAGVRDLGRRGTQLVTLLKTGEWMFVWPEGRSTGPALPADGELVSVGGDGERVWAVGRVAGGMASVPPPPTTAPTTRPMSDDLPPAAATSPTTRAAAAAATTAPAGGPPKLVLFRLDRTNWLAEADLPDEVPANVRSLSMDVVRGRVIVTAVLDGTAVVYERSGDAPAGWREAGRLKPETTQVVRAKVLDGGDRPIVWVAGQQGAGVLYVASGQQQQSQQPWGDPVQLRVVGADLSQPTPRDVTVVAQRVRLVFAKGEKLFVQSYDWRTGEPKGQLTPITPASGSADDRTGFWINAAIMTVLLMVMVGAMRRRGEIEETVRRIERVPLAPLGHRVGAAVVDLWPYVAVVVYVLVRYGPPADMESQLADPRYVQYSSIAMGVYIAHTMLLEMLFGASIGKMIFGLRVVRLDGERPGRGALFVRNVMRAVDFGLLFVGAVMILMSPLRQRLGDLAAGTIVVRRTVRPDELVNEEQLAGTGKE